MIELQGLTKRYGDTLAVDAVSATVAPGVVTGFLGPNGAGKSTTMRLILGLDRPTSGVALVNGRHYVAAPAPMAEVGGLLETLGMRNAGQVDSNVARYEAWVPEALWPALVEAGLVEPAAVA